MKAFLTLKKAITLSREMFVFIAVQTNEGIFLLKRKRLNFIESNNYQNVRAPIRKSYG